jgi:carboxyl-terminal processing protease
MNRRILNTLLPAAIIAMVPSTTSVQAANPGSTYRELDRLMDVFERVRAEYVDEITDEKLIEGAINGMLASLDPHSSYLNVRDFDRMRTQTDGEYGGLGLTVSLEDGVVKVVAPTDDTPAARAGVKAGDYITHLDDELIYGLTLDEAVDRMRGLPGTPIKITIVRTGEDKPIDLTLKREIIELKPVRHEVRDNIGLIRISTFNKQTGQATREAIAAVEKKAGPDLLGFVVDLRSNPGGLLDQAIEVSDAFLERGEIVSQRGRRKGDIQRYYARTGDDTDGKPIVVLVDEGSASAAEIVAGALQDHRRALVLGQRSFGKGSVQTLIPMTQDTALRLTTARYYTPSGRSVQEEGIEPDVAVPQLSDPNYKERRVVREADLRQHLRNDAVKDDKVIEEDDKANPRFTRTAADLEKAGVKDYQLDYALKLIGRLGPSVLLRTAEVQR